MSDQPDKEDVTAMRNLQDGRYRQVDGVKVLLRRHHSTGVTLKTKYQEIKL